MGSLFGATWRVLHGRLGNSSSSGPLPASSPSSTSSFSSEKLSPSSDPNTVPFRQIKVRAILLLILPAKFYTHVNRHSIFILAGECILQGSVLLHVVIESRPSLVHLQTQVIVVLAYLFYYFSFPSSI